MSDWLFTSDLHGQSDLYEQVLAEAARGRARVVVLGGDLAPHASGAAGPGYQRVFLEGFLVEFARRLREAVSGVELALLMGNDDWRANEDVLERRHGDLWHYLHGRVLELDGVRVAGCSFVPITPFQIKDWERWEDGGPESPARLEGWTSVGGALRAHRFDPDRREPTIAGALAELETQADLAGAIHVLHSPPRDTCCDLTHRREHVGSRAIRAHLERVAPPLSLSGHIHESPHVSGAWRDTVGATVVVNPGQFAGRGVCAVWFDPARPAETLRHTVRA